MSESCVWENCPILAIIDEIGIDSFAECIRTERKRVAGLLKDGACMVLFIQSQLRKNKNEHR